MCAPGSRPRPRRLPCGRNTALSQGGWEAFVAQEPRLPEPPQTLEGQVHICTHLTAGETEAHKPSVPWQSWSLNRALPRAILFACGSLEGSADTGAGGRRHVGTEAPLDLRAMPMAGCGPQTTHPSQSRRAGKTRRGLDEASQLMERLIPGREGGSWVLGAGEGGIDG